MTKPPSLTDIAYLAGLFDGEGSVYFKKTRQKKHKRPGKPTHNVMVIRIEMSMTDKSVMEWVFNLVKCGNLKLNVKNKSPSSKPHWKDQWRWRCSHRDAYGVAKLLWPFAQVKLHKLEQIIDYYEPEHEAPNVVSLESYRNE
jgi:hypothetical protein